MVGGSEDTDNQWPYVGEYVWEYGGACSGILITPAWVLTANHCVTGGVTDGWCGIKAVGIPLDRRDDDLWISFSPRGIKDSNAAIWGTHTAGTSGSVKVLIDEPVDQCKPELVAQDLALIQLDKRIEMRDLRPFHVPKVGPTDTLSCKELGDVESFSAWLIGYGGSSDWRKSLYAGGWWRESHSTGAVYSRLVTWKPGEGYPGTSEPGDSGGALVRFATLCGITSGHISSLGPARRRTNTAAVDSPEAIHFITKHVVDDDGRLMGECLPNEGPAHLQDVDSDGDLLPDACDPCPYFADPNYRSTGVVTVYTDPRTGEKFGPGCCPASYRNLPGYTPALELAHSDDDGIPDLCDTCPEMSNLDQLDEVEPDLDQDGIPDRCDNCAGVATVRPGVDKLLMPAYPEADDDDDGVGNVCDWCTSPVAEDRVFEQELANCNMEAELAIHYPGQTMVPVVRPGWSYAADLAKYQEAFRIGTCDEACPMIRLGDGIFPQGQHPSYPCIPPEAGACAFVMRNGITHVPTPSPSTVNGMATTHTKWCDCPDGNMETREGRAYCLQTYGCRPVRQQFAGAQWLDLQTTSTFSTEGFPDWNAMGPEVHTLRFNGEAQGPTLWDYMALGAPYVKNPGDILTAHVNGVLWSNIRGGFGFANGSDNELRLQERGSFVETGAGYAERRMSMYLLDFPVRIDPEIPIPCYECGAGTDMRQSNLFVVSPGPDELGRMELIVTPRGVRHVPGLLNPSARDTLHATHALEQTVVPVGEPLGTLEQKLPGQLTLRALTVSRATGMPVASLTTAGLHGSLEAAPLFDVVKMAERSLTPGPLSNEEGLALSGERQELYRFGASSGSAWTYHLPSRSWSKTALAAGRRPGRVLSATYRHQDQAVYEVDRGALLLTRLRRWVPGADRFQTVAMWPTPWRSFSRYWLVNGHGGELFLVGSRTGLSAIAKFFPDASGALRFGGVLVLQETIAAMPVASRNTIGYVVRAPGDTITGGGAKQKHVPIASIGRWLAGWCPQQGVE